VRRRAAARRSGAGARSAVAKRRRAGNGGAPEGATRDRIIAAGTKLYAERGYAAASMRELAGRAGVSLSASYYHFPGKQDVLVAIMVEAMERLERGALEVLERGLPPLERLPALVRSHVIVHLEAPDAARVADRELRSLEPESQPKIISLRNRYESYFRDALSEGVANGSFSDALDVPVTAMAIITMSTATLEWWRPDGRLNPEQTGEVISDLALAMALHGDQAGNHPRAKGSGRT
jgi:AcrR family transcriptional regulator